MCTAAPASRPRRAAAASSSPATAGRPGSTSTAMTRDARGAAPPPRAGAGAGSASAPGRRPTSSAPRRRSSRTASSTCSSSGPSSTRFARAWSMGRVSPTTVGLPSSPQGPAPSSAAPIRVRRSAGTAARPAGSTLQGSQRRSATDRTAGRVISASWVPSSCSSSRRSAAPRSSRWRTPLAKGRSSSSATSGPTWPVSPSMELRPSSTRSKGPAARSAAASARALASVSDPANASSQTCSPESAPQATASRSASSALGGPRVTTVQVPPVAAASETPWETARRQYAFISTSTSRRTSRPPSRRIDSATGTCLTSAAMRNGAPAARVTGTGLTGRSMRPRYRPRRDAPAGAGCVSGRWRRPRGCAGRTPRPAGASRRRPGPR